MKKIVYSVIAVLLLAGGYFIFRNGVPFLGNKTTETNLPDILFLTSPVTEFTGKVDKVSDKAIWVSGKYSITSVPTLPNNPTNVPGQVITVPPLPPTKTLSYKVNIASYTQITRPDFTVVYLFNKNTPTPTPKLTVNDIKTGQVVTVSTTRDLRSNTSKEVEAYTIKLQPLMNKLTGKITSIKSNEGMIILKAMTPGRALMNEPTSAPVENEYAVSVTQATEISHLEPADTAKTGTTPKPPKPVKYDITDLKEGIQITVYADSDVIDNRKIKALRIEPAADFVSSKLSASSTPTLPPKK
ncbi:hypothetical protein A3D03_05230 [Candidatus Gottesmanbacteria bacterium RIFCSPHIGHO2_02_FULL_40_13]|uniref:DUF5666 domain-containing protein n=1 Tax=Candidatus Gottesmanbacteria bacterium RIFCSPHIGHO2_02_FULL_40_13 TaxID=1798384 RepID=A0A1F6A980_9BACT|nr:MAG: hypothetical protein A3D03_05230 [Candidatus Gottesmanbacteria bacterium RIFCSPHIGHO2_02_FULL_40_13]